MDALHDFLGVSEQPVIAVHPRRSPTYAPFDYLPDELISKIVLASEDVKALAQVSRRFYPIARLATTFALTDEVHSTGFLLLLFLNPALVAHVRHLVIGRLRRVPVEAGPGPSLTWLVKTASLVLQACSNLYSVTVQELPTSMEELGQLLQGLDRHRATLKLIILGRDRHLPTNLDTAAPVLAQLPPCREFHAVWTFPSSRDDLKRTLEMLHIWRGCRSLDLSLVDFEPKQLRTVVEVVTADESPLEQLHLSLVAYKSPTVLDVWQDFESVKTWPRVLIVDIALDLRVLVSATVFRAPGLPATVPAYLQRMSLAVIWPNSPRTLLYIFPHHDIDLIASSVSQQNWPFDQVQIYSPPNASRAPGTPYARLATFMASIGRPFRVHE